MRVLTAALLLAAAAPAWGHEQPADEFRTLRELDQKLFQTGWNLATGNAEYCADAAPALGVLWQDLANYPDPHAARRSLDAVGPLVAQAVAKGSPAERSGLAVGETLQAINGLPSADQFPPTNPQWQRIVALQDAIDLLLGRNGSIYLAWLDATSGTIAARTIEGVPACPSRFEVGPIGERAAADGTRVVLGTEFPGFAYLEDEFAAAVAHEMAHNLLGHRAWLDTKGRKRKNVRVTEREADRLAPWLLRNAGYEPGAMIRMLERARPKAGGNFLTGRTHGGWDDRAEIIAAEIETMRTVVDTEGRADWSRHFKRETAE